MVEPSLPQIEQKLKQVILPELEKGRPNFDKPHTLEVVRKLKEILKHIANPDIDAMVLIISAYAHDWGYADLFDSGTNAQLHVVKQHKEAHMEIGARKIADLLEDAFFSFLSEERKQRIVHLVRVHDRVESLKDDDEIILAEADTLGALDVSRVIPTFDKQSNQAYMKGVLEKRLPVFRNEYSKNEFRRLFLDRENYYSSFL